MNQKKLDVKALLVWFPLVISEERLANGSELIDVDRIVPEKENVKKAAYMNLEINSYVDKFFFASYSSLSNAAKHASIFVAPHLYNVRCVS